MLSIDQIAKAALLFLGKAQRGSDPMGGSARQALLAP
jgi:hypothetical protein